MPGISAILWLALWQPDTGTQGITEFNRGNYAASRVLLEKASDTPRNATFLAMSRAALGDCQSAEPELARRFAPSTEAGLRKLAGLALAQCRISAKQFTAVASTVTELERDFPTDPDVLYVSAAYHLKAWNDTVYRMYKNAPASFRVDQLSAEVFETQNKYPEAIAEYRKAIAKNPKAIDLHYRLGRALMAQSHDASALNEAREAFVNELTLNPYDAGAEYQIGQIFASQSKTPEATAHFERAAELRPDFPEALIAVAKARLAAKRYPEAISLLERAVRLQPRSEAAHYNLMLAYRNAGRTADAQREKATIDQLQKPPEGEFTNFLKRLGDIPPPK